MLFSSLLAKASHALSTRLFAQTRPDQITRKEEELLDPTPRYSNICIYNVLVCVYDVG